VNILTGVKDCCSLKKIVEEEYTEWEIFSWHSTEDMIKVCNVIVGLKLRVMRYPVK
jgi:hypothetical protein